MTPYGWHKAVDEAKFKRDGVWPSDGKEYSNTQSIYPGKISCFHSSVTDWHSCEVTGKSTQQEVSHPCCNPICIVRSESLLPGADMLMAQTQGQAKGLIVKGDMWGLSSLLWPGKLFFSLSGIHLAYTTASTNIYNISLIGHAVNKDELSRDRYMYSIN